MLRSYCKVTASPCGTKPTQDYRCDIRAVVASIGEDPDRVTTYALRHSSIVRMLLKNIPVRLVAGLHDTSIVMIEKNYSHFITEHADEHASSALLESREPKPATADNVIALVK